MGIESLLAGELRGMEASNIKETRSGVSCDGVVETALRICLWSRFANRVLMPLAVFPAATPEELYDGVRSIPWEDHLSPANTLAVDTTVSGSEISHSRYAALKIKDAVVDRFRDQVGRRPSVQVKNPDVRINARIHRNQATISLDLSGESLHKRGYRQDKGIAPLKENLAAAILARAGWPGMAAEGRPFIDPMCGAGTLPIEAALMAADIAPGLLRPYFGFMGWKGFDPRVWTHLQVEARYRRKDGFIHLPVITGYDVDGRILKSARENLKRAGLDGKITFQSQDIGSLRSPGEGNFGLVAVNPPYGERQGEVDKLKGLYQRLGKTLRENFEGWNASIFTGNPDLGKEMGIRAVRTHTLYNGAIKCKLIHFTIKKSRFFKETLTAGGWPKTPGTPASREAGGGMFANRLRKNIRTIGKWAEEEGITCYRLYGADIPEYNVAVDVYGDLVHVQEYRAPATVEAAGAEARLRQVMSIIPEVLKIPAEKIFLKVRERQRGRSQYEKLHESGRFHEVTEGGLKFLVNLEDYLDTGLFLDHRLTRKMVGEMARGKNFLNLFAYTGAATVHAAAGGASFTTSVDMSNTYTDWARKNMALNGLKGKNHRFIKADCMKWIEAAKARYDLIFLDPPTFSASKGMEGTFDVQRDHVGLITGTAKLLSGSGILIFSNNRRGFEMDLASLSGLIVEDITARTIPRDFARNPGVHNCWRIARES